MRGKGASVKEGKRNKVPALALLHPRTKITSLKYNGSPLAFNVRNMSAVTIAPIDIRPYPGASLCIRGPLAFRPLHRSPQ